MYYPFSAVVGHEDLRLALVLNAIHPAVGGVLARGEKGTAKSTMVRALAAVLPQVEVVPGCRFACDPGAPDAGCPDGPHTVENPPGANPVESRGAHLVELPVGASEDRLTGSLDLERALGRGEAVYQPGLLAAAHRGLLYVDEVNLLPDHLVDVLLDAAAMGVAHVERDGVSVRHAARFILVGTMNPEEGELRPQLLDRFGLTVEIAASRDPKERAEVVRRRLAFEADPEAFAARWAEADVLLGEQIAAARALLPSVVLPDGELERIARICAAFEVDGMRADLVTARAAVALAAWHGRTAVTAEDVRDAARLALPHRRRRNPFDAPGLDQDKLDEAAQDPQTPESDAGPQESQDPDSQRPDDQSGPRDPGDGGHDPGDGPGDGAPVPEDSDPVETSEASSSDSDPAAPSQPPAGSVPNQAPAAAQPAVAAQEPYRTKLFAVPGIGQGAPGRRSAGRSEGRGRTVGAEVPHSRHLAAVHLPATVRAAAAHQSERGRVAGGAILLRSEDLRSPIRRDREGNLVLFAVDASGSMAARARMAAVKGAVLSLLVDAYQRRDKVGLVTFRGTTAEVALPPTGSVEAAAARLQALPTGGRTPLAAGLLAAAEVLRLERMRDPRRRPLLVVVTDGRATAGLGTISSSAGSRASNSNAVADSRRAAGLLAAAGVASLVVDCESGPIRLGLAAGLAEALGGDHVPMAQLAADALVDAVRGAAEYTGGYTSGYTSGRKAS